MVIRCDPALLSSRYADNGISTVPTGRRARAMLRTLAADLRNKDSGRMGEHAQCPCCGGHRAWRIAERDRYAIPAVMLLCQGCGLVFAQHWMTPDTAKTYYGEIAHLLKTQTADPSELFQRRTAQDAYCWKRHDWIKTSLGERSAQIRQVVEIGCSDGANLVPFARDGVQVSGYDLDAVRVAQGRSQGLDLHVGTFPPADREPADLVILSHVIEHVVDVAAFLSQAAGLLRPGGWLYVEVPGIGHIGPAGRNPSYPGYPSTNDYMGLRQFEHNYDFDLDALCRFADLAGLHVENGDESARCIMSSGRRPLPVPAPERRLESLRAGEMDWQKNQFYGKKLARVAVNAARSWLRP